MIQIQYIAIIISLLALVYSAYLSFKILRSSPGSAKMQEISDAIKEGAMAYMKRQYTTIAIFAVIITALLYYLFGLAVASGFLFGAILSAISGFVGMSISVRANVRTAEAAKRPFRLN